MNNSRDLELEKKIDAYVKGQLSEEEAEKLWVKLLQRPDYIELLETELGVQSIIQKRSSSDSDDTERGDNSSTEESGVIYALKNSRSWIAAAAAVVLLVVAINVFQTDTNQDIGKLAVGEINFAENLASAQILRSQKTNVSPADSLLNRGFQAAISGNVSQAIDMYNEIISKHADEPAAIQAYLNKGIIQYNSGDYREAISAFQSTLRKVEDKPVVKEKAHWYMGNAYINVDSLEKARKTIQEAYAMDGIYRNPAYRLLRKLDYKLGNIDQEEFEQQIKDSE